MTVPFKHKILGRNFAHRLESVSKIGWIINKKVGKANTRNRVRRLMREFFRLNRDRLKNSFDLVMVAKQKAADVGKYKDMEGILLKDLRRINAHLEKLNVFLL